MPPYRSSRPLKDSSGEALSGKSISGSPSNHPSNSDFGIIKADTARDLPLLQFPDLSETTRSPKRESSEDSFRPLNKDAEAPGGFQALRFENHQEIYHDPEEREVRKRAELARAVKDAERRVISIEAEARVAGQEQGRAEGLEEIRERFAGLLEDLTRELDRTADIRAEMLRRLQTETADLALAVAEKIAAHEIRQVDETLMDMIRQALEKEVELGRVVIRVNPQDAERLDLDRLQTELPPGAVRRLSLEPDERVRDGCMLELPSGLLDLRLMPQMERIREVFAAVDPAE